MILVGVFLVISQALVTCVVPSALGPLGGLAGQQLGSNPKKSTFKIVDE